MSQSNFSKRGTDAEDPIQLLEEVSHEGILLENLSGHNGHEKSNRSGRINMSPMSVDKWWWLHWQQIILTLIVNCSIMIIMMTRIIVNDNDDNEHETW